MRSNRLTKHVFLSEVAERRDNWCSDVLKIFKVLDIEFMCDNFLICNIHVLEQQLRDLETKICKENVGNKPKLRLCKEQDKDRERSLELNIYRKERSVLYL